MRSNVHADPVSLHLDKKLAHFSSTHSECYIYKVQNRLRQLNEKAYEPDILAIGPYHHGKDNLRIMQKHKLSYLRLLLERTNQTSVDRYIAAMRDLQERTQGCYADSINLNKDEFVKMMLLDGCFIIEFFRKFTMTSMRNKHDSIFKMGVLRSIWRDLMLIENQLPFFVLTELFNMTKVSDPRDNLVDLVLRFVGQPYYRGDSPGPEIFLKVSIGISTHDVKHLLGLVHHIKISLFATFESRRNVGDKKTTWERMQCTTELREAGIRIKKATLGTPIFDIKFTNGALEIPQFRIDKRTECLFRNIVAHEEHLQDSEPKYITDYLTLLCCLINSTEDVSLLRRCGILNNMLGNDEAVSALFSKSSSCVFETFDDFCYSELVSSVNAHCRQRRNIWTAKLRRNYFNSPWSIISFLGAILLVLFALVQTMVSILAYFSHKS